MVRFIANVWNKIREGSDGARCFCIVGTVSLAVVVVAYFDLSSGCCHPWTKKANDNFYSLQLQFVINILQNQFQLDPRSLKTIILGYPKVLLFGKLQNNDLVFHCSNFYIVVLQNSLPEATAKQRILGTPYMSFLSDSVIKVWKIQQFIHLWKWKNYVYSAKFKIKIYFK